MPLWQPTPPEGASEYSHRIIRTPAAAAIKAIATSVDPCGCTTHFLNNRTTPCEGQGNCEACRLGFSGRWHGYLGALLADTLEHVIFEYTACAASTFANYYEHHKTLRMCAFRAIRPSGRANGRVVIQTHTADAQKWRLPDPPDLMLVLCHVWGIATKNVTPSRNNRVPPPDLKVAPDPGDGRNRATQHRK